MKIFVTGSTGFVGAHTAKALMDKGHEVRLLVRNKTFAENYFAELGYPLNDIVIADMCDKTAVKAAIEGTDAVFHAAAMVSLDPKKADEIYRTNIASIDAVIGSAIELGINNIVYVSSLAALFNKGATELNEQSPLGTPHDAYTRSKRDCEQYVRDLQAKGAPIQITYPSGIFGPNDPRLNESNHAMVTMLRDILPITSTGIQCVDVRDLAALHVYLLENPPIGDISNARFILAGNYYPWAEFHQMLQNITGKKIFSLPLPGPLLRICGHLMDWVKKVYPMDFPMTSEAMEIVTRWVIADSSKALQHANLRFRSGEETFTDTIAWLVKAGHLPQKYAGKITPQLSKN